MDDAQIKEMVRARYGGIAEAAGDASCCGPAAACCGDVAPTTPAAKSREMGYSDAELSAVPDGANLGLGCGNPQAIAALRPGEVVLDLGSGAGFDCFLAAQQVGKTGRVIGVDMTHEMLKKARENAAKIGAANVEFRLGELEHLPVADNTVDVAISNCVINLVPDKAQVFRETFRVLKPGGRIAISDVVNKTPLSAELKADTGLLCGCVAGAASVDQLTRWLSDAGFVGIQITPKPESRELIATWAPGRGIEDYVVSGSSRPESRDRQDLQRLFLCTGNSARSILAEVPNPVHCRLVLTHLLLAEVQLFRQHRLRVAPRHALATDARRNVADQSALHTAPGEVPRVILQGHAAGVSPRPLPRGLRHSCTLGHVAAPSVAMEAQAMQIANPSSWLTPSNLAGTPLEQPKWAVFTRGQPEPAAAGLERRPVAAPAGAAAAGRIPRRALREARRQQARH